MQPNHTKTYAERQKEASDRYREKHREEINARKRQRRTAARHAAGRLTAYEYFLQKLAGPIDKDQCLVWNHRGIPKRYAQLTFTIDGVRRTEQAHRLAYERTKGPIPEGVMICHSCDNPPCFNPHHLWPGTGTDNLVDAITKGRRKTLRGSEIGTSKLDPQMVLAIRDDYDSHRFTVEEIAREYDICASTVCKIGKRKRWRSI